MSFAKQKKWVSLAAALAVLCCAPVASAQQSLLEYPSIHSPRVGLDGMVVSQNEVASAIGAKVLANGGNAIDAAAVVQFVLNVVEPTSSGLGGGGFMVYRTYDGKTGALDYREKAPLAASKNMYLDENGAIIEGKSTIGAMAIGIPGTVDGLFKVHEKFGTLPFSELIPL